MNDQTLAETLSLIFGEKPFSYYLAGFFFSFLAIVLSLYMHSRKRDKHSPETPYNFSWRFLLWDNTKRIIASLILMFIFFRAWDLTNIFLQIGLGFAVSFGLDKLLQFLMDKTDFWKFLQSDREKFIDKKTPPNE